MYEPPEGYALIEVGVSRACITEGHRRATRFVPNPWTND